MVQYFHDGGNFMWPILGALLIGLGFAIERFYSLVISQVDTQNLFKDVTEALDSGDNDKALQICSDTEGPVAAIFHAGLSRTHRGLKDVEKSIQDTGAIEMAFLKRT